MNLTTVLFLTMVTFAAAVQQFNSENGETYLVTEESEEILRSYAYLELFRESDFGGPTMFFGAGTLIRNNLVLTAAQNVAGFKSWRVGLGLNQISDMEWSYATSAVIHPGYNELTLGDNLAIIRLNRTTPSNNHISGISRISGPNTSPPVGRVLQMIGFGFDRTGQQPKIFETRQVTVTNQADCQSSYPHFNYTLQVLSNFCARTGSLQTTMCAGDQGGPVYESTSFGPILFGVQSFYRDADSLLHPFVCLTSQPPLFVRITMYADWISSVFNE